MPPLGKSSLARLDLATHTNCTHTSNTGAASTHTNCTHTSDTGEAHTNCAHTNSDKDDPPSHTDSITITNTE